MKQKILLIVFLLIPTMLSAQWTDEYATWVSLGAKKNLGTKWSLGLEAEYRAQENARWAVGVDALTCMKLGGWSEYRTMIQIYTHLDEKKKQADVEKLRQLWTSE